MKFFQLFAVALLSFLLNLAAQAQTNIPQLVNFQAVARDASGNIVGNATIQVKLSVLQGSAAGTPVFCGVYNRTTNQFGSFSIEIGSIPDFTCFGVASDLATVPWEDGNTFIKVEYTPVIGGAFIDLGTIQLTSTFYAFAASIAERLVNVDLSGATAGQVLQFNGTEWVPATLIGGGSTTSLAAGQGIGISTNGTVTTISNTGDADNSPTNELQTLSINGNQLSLSNSNTVTLPTSGGGGTTYTAGAGVTITNNVIAAKDTSATNEIQQLTLAGNTLSLSNGGGSVNLPGGGSGSMSTPFWQQHIFTSLIGAERYCTSSSSNSCTNPYIISCVTSTNDGKSIFVAMNGEYPGSPNSNRKSKIILIQKDSISGSFFIKKEVDMTVPVNGTLQSTWYGNGIGSMAMVGNAIFVSIYYSPTNSGSTSTWTNNVYSWDLGLNTQSTMTINPALTSNIQWLGANGTELLIGTTGLNYAKYQIISTALINIGNISFSGFPTNINTSSLNFSSSLWDGTNLLIQATGWTNTSVFINKYYKFNILGIFISESDIKISTQNTVTNNPDLLFNISAYPLFKGNTGYNSGALFHNVLVLTPISKP